MPEFEYMNRHLYSDIIPFEVIKIAPSGKTITVREMDAKAVNHPDLISIGGFAATWEITSNENHPSIKVRLHKDAQWRDADGNRYVPSDRPIKYYDRSF